MSKSAIAELPPSAAAAISWKLAQTFWVGGLWLLHFVMLPALEKYGLAPLLVDELSRSLSGLLVGFSAFCAVLQLLVLVRWVPWPSLRHDLRGQLLVTVVLMAGLYGLLSHWQPDAAYWLVFNYLVLAFCGLALVLQPVPGG